MPEGQEHDNYNHVQLSDSDSSANEAVGLDLDLTVTPEPNWPGTSVDPNRQRHNTQLMREVAGRLEDYVTNNLEGANSSGTPGSLMSLAEVNYGPDHWGPAHKLKQASGDVTRLVTEYSALLIQNLRDAATAIRAAADAYDGVESANLATANNAQRNLGGNTQTSNW